MELTETLDKHNKWLKGDPEGSRANLRGANLGYANLRGANLRDVNLVDANLRDVNLVDANLRGANLVDANLRGANLGYANLRGANLVEANLVDARFPSVNLSESMGLIWAQVGPIGEGRRTTTAVWQDGQITHHAGCFVGNREAYETRIAAGGWDWLEEMDDLYAAECLAAIEWCEASIRAQLAWITANPETGTPE